jgi:hypothetical protein
LGVVDIGAMGLGLMDLMATNHFYIFRQQPDWSGHQEVRQAQFWTGPSLPVSAIGR